MRLTEAPPRRASIVVVSAVVKVLLTLAVALPLAAYVTGSLVSGAEQSPTRERIVIQDEPASAPPATEERREEGQGPEPPVDDPADADGRDDDGRTRERDGRADDDGDDADDTDEDIAGRASGDRDDRDDDGGDDDDGGEDDDGGADDDD